MVHKITSSNSLSHTFNFDKVVPKFDSARGRSSEKWDFRESFAMSFFFHDTAHLFGIPERADTFVLKTTEDTDPYRLYNMDVFPHSVYEPEGLYGSIPYITSHTKDYDASVLWMNAAETWVDIRKLTHQSKQGRLTTFLSESGVMEFFIVGSANPSK